MKLYLFLTSFAIFALTCKSYGQCNVETIENTNYTRFLHGFEDIKKITNFRSWISYSIMIKKDSDGKSINQLTLIVTGSSHQNSYFVIPRRVTISFTTGDVLQISAESMKTESYGNGMIYMSEFVVRSEDIKQLYKPIRQFTFIDHRENKQYTEIPDYNHILVEQLRCIDNQYNVKFN